LRFENTLEGAHHLVKLSDEYTDVFGKEGLEWLRNLNLSSIDQQILQSNLQILETLNAQVRSADIQIAKDALKAARIRFSEEEVIAMELDNRPGALGER